MAPTGTPPPQQPPTPAWSHEEYVPARAFEDGPLEVPKPPPSPRKDSLSPNAAPVIDMNKLIAKFLPPKKPPVAAAVPKTVPKGPNTDRSSKAPHHAPDTRHHGNGRRSGSRERGDCTYLPSARYGHYEPTHRRHNEAASQRSRRSASPRRGFLTHSRPELPYSYPHLITRFADPATYHSLSISELESEARARDLRPSDFANLAHALAHNDALFDEAYSGFEKIDLDAALLRAEAIAKGVPYLDSRVDYSAGDLAWRLADHDAWQAMAAFGKKTEHKKVVEKEDKKESPGKKIELVRQKVSHRSDTDEEDKPPLAPTRATRRPLPPPSDDDHTLSQLVPKKRKLVPTPDTEKATASDPIKDTCKKATATAPIKGTSKKPATATEPKPPIKDTSKKATAAAPAKDTSKKPATATEPKPPRKLKPLKTRKPPPQPANPPSPISKAASAAHSSGSPSTDATEHSASPSTDATERSESHSQAPTAHTTPSPPIAKATRSSRRLHKRSASPFLELPDSYDDSEAKGVSKQGTSKRKRKQRVEETEEENTNEEDEGGSDEDDFIVPDMPAPKKKKRKAAGANRDVKKFFRV
ncbi:hypothetical protein BDV95DRAFT_606529 [Massariosphaeria phaeospora]|uniref:Uncharacterized protein n=1 Tax=Massariosphaeria phaeospora TaxID=100035 RepID=A0A7C8M8I9_9PLEO|nr:hypothetical protein BDV95DRAFT_606529 [Massariosphaeria phaeospora]